ncbi:hypothetical protein JOL62DRAFT_249954 [Phyllosticta paracitricarpa]|uniref:Uncharacterized protein n=1 Tax=Phyllosticta paracitricarpa TaxID=2016321 RepID=A0ABR1MYA8_9PEZI
MASSSVDAANTTMVAVVVATDCTAITASARPRAAVCGHVLPSTLRVTRSRAAAATRKTSNTRKTTTVHTARATTTTTNTPTQSLSTCGPRSGLCALCHRLNALRQRLLRERRKLRSRQVDAVAAGGQTHRRWARERNRALAALRNWEARIQVWEEEEKEEEEKEEEERKTRRVEEEEEGQGGRSASAPQKSCRRVAFARNEGGKGIGEGEDGGDEDGEEGEEEEEEYRLPAAYARPQPDRPNPAYVPGRYAVSPQRKKRGSEGAGYITGHLMSKTRRAEEGNLLAVVCSGSSAGRSI